MKFIGELKKINQSYKSVKIADKILKMENNKWMFTRQGIQTFFEVIVIKIV